MKIKIPIGDWSGDGHGKVENIFIESNTPVKTLQQGYKDSCKLTGIAFNYNGSVTEDYTGLNLKWDHPEAKDRRIATEYLSATISKLAEKILLNHGIDVRAGFEDADKDELIYFDGSEHFVKILMKFIKLSVPSFEYSIVKEEVPVLNGYWNPNLNVQFGYGLFE